MYKYHPHVLHGTLLHVFIHLVHTRICTLHYIYIFVSPVSADFTYFVYIWICILLYIWLCTLYSAVMYVVLYSYYIVYKIPWVPSYLLLLTKSCVWYSGTIYIVVNYNSFWDIMLYILWCIVIHSKIYYIYPNML